MCEYLKTAIWNSAIASHPFTSDILNENATHTLYTVIFYGYKL